MRIFLLAIFFLTASCTAQAQQSNCDNKLDSATVKRIALRKDAYWTGHWLYQPTMRFDSLGCIWIVSSTKAARTEEGNCKNTNGCTKITTVTLVIGARKKRVISRTEETHLYPNYE